VRKIDRVYGAEGDEEKEQEVVRFKWKIAERRKRARVAGKETKGGCEGFKAAIRLR